MTNPLLLNADYFLDPRKAFEVVGKELFGDNWKPDCIDDPKDDRHRKVLLAFRNALRSGAVSAHWSTLDLRGSGHLLPADADQEFFRIMLHEDLVFHEGMNEPVRCRVHAEQLRRYLRGPEPQAAAPTQLAKRQCFEWLVQMFEDRTLAIPVTETLRKQANEKFNRLSNRGFRDARKLAIEKTGRYDLAKAGRRKNSISN